MVSSKVTHAVRKKIGTRQVGHVGTLDPLAEGVLALAIGRATRLQDYLLENKKSYQCDIFLGEARDTMDQEGIVVKEAPVPTDLDSIKIKKVLAGFLGKQSQIAPLYSAIKYKGKPLYEYARKGQSHLVPKERLSREINIKSIELIDFCSPKITFEATVGKGTYIRTLAQDIAVKVGTVGYVSRLKRTQDAGASLAECLDWQWFEDASKEEVCSKILDITDISIPSLPKLKLHHPKDVTSLFQGKEVEILISKNSQSELEIPTSSIKMGCLEVTCQQVRVIDTENRTLGIAEIRNKQNDTLLIKLKRGLI